MHPHAFSPFALAFLVIVVSCVMANGDTVDDYLQQAGRALKNHEAEKAVELAGKAIAADPKNARGYLLRGGGYEVLRQHEKAIADFTRCIELDPKAAAAYDH